MIIVEPSFEIQYDLDRQPIAVRLETCGRICYKSEDKITEESAVPFVKKIAAHGHNSVLEMAVATYNVVCHPDHVLEFHACQPKFFVTDRTDSGFIVTGSIRAFREMYGNYADNSVVSELVRDLAGRYQYLFEGVYLPAESLPPHEEISITKLSLDEVEDLPVNLLARHRFVGVKMITNRAVTHELVRHRPCSYLQESQRYCRYNQDKFGNQVTFIKPMFYEDGSPEYQLWKEAMEETEKLYLKLLENSTPQAARTVLPNSCKTEIITYCNLEEWKHIFSLRTSPAAEPSMREIMIPLEEEMRKRFPVL
ncbi:FAD-dependent thymidylate synthase [Desulfosediminicola ganghwensis]|uniref:FAD-dependent thymidylate synthase n=1 Tax=Desulfosediminicola ganghwensis TaxID=2569540 RepID=UPI0010ACC031|nr:FAD-dependent thymidylate synthase [Desulfosediminicola ganghwensis]